VSRVQRRAKQCKRDQRASHRQPAIYLVFELEDISDPEIAQKLLSRIGLPVSPMLVAKERLVLAVFRSPGPVNDCVMVTDGDRVLGMFHGTDCTLSTRVRQCTGKPLPAAFNARCDRRAAGGVFRVLDVNEMRAR
jgi:hypothetical protein